MNNEPVAWMELYFGEPNNLAWDNTELRDSGDVYKTIPLYTHPANKKVEKNTDLYEKVCNCTKKLDLTDEEITEVIKKIASNNEYVYSLYEDFEGIEFSRVGIFEFARAILRKAQEK